MVFWKRGGRKETYEVHGQDDTQILASFYGAHSHTKKPHNRCSSTSTAAIVELRKDESATQAREENSEQGGRERSRYSSIDKNKSPVAPTTTRQAVSSHILAPELQCSFLGVLCDYGNNVVTESGSGTVRHSCYSLSRRSHQRGRSPPRSIQSNLRPALSGIWSSDEAPSMLMKHSCLKAKQSSTLFDSRHDSSSVNRDVDVLCSPSPSSNRSRVSRQAPPPSNEKRRLSSKNSLARTRTAPGPRASNE
jgi:hypothetical protein